MEIPFDFYATPTPGEQTENKHYHARIVGGRTVEEKELIEHISQRCTLTPGDIRAALSELNAEIVANLRSGNRVHLPGLGYFYLSLSAPKEADPSKTHAQSIQVKNIEFRADKELKKEMAKQVTFVRVKAKQHSSPLDIYEVDALLVDYFHEHPYLTRKDLEALCGFTKTMAQKYLRQLLEEGRIVNLGTKQSPIYEPAKGFYGKA